MSDKIAERKHVVISGGSRGLGEALVKGLLQAGYCVSTFSRHATPFTEELATERNFFYASADISNESSVVEFLECAEQRFGLPYGLINCAGVASDGVLATLSDEVIQTVLDVNLKGPLRLTKLVSRKMLLSREGGAILNISSIVGLRGYNGLAVYSATKGGLDAMTRALARELGRRRIRVNSIAPGYIETEMTHDLGAEQRDQIVRRTPLGRLGGPSDVVGAAIFLLSPASDFITGHVLVVDGGITC
ncbi:MAG: SDR family NAD(P)-dependent oxidoreductase [Candidatus Acidiferrales bacterium]